MALIGVNGRCVDMSNQQKYCKSKRLRPIGISSLLKLLREEGARSICAYASFCCIRTSRICIPIYSHCCEPFVSLHLLHDSRVSQAVS